MSIEIKSNRTKTYVFSTTDLDDSAIQSLRNKISEHNKNRCSGDRAKYVKVRARGPRHGVAHWCQELPLAYGTYFDVYVYDRFEW